MSKTLTAVEICHSVDGGKPLYNGYIKILELKTASIIGPSLFAKFTKKKGYIVNNFYINKISAAEESSYVSNELKKIFLQNKLSKQNVYMNINDAFVNTYNFLLPEMPKYDLEKAIEYEIKKSLSFPISNVIFDYIYTYPQNNIDTEKDFNLRITAFVVKKDDIEILKNIFLNSDIKLKAIECKTTSLLNAHLYANSNKAGHCLLCDIVSDSIKILIIYNNTITFERTIEITDFEKYNVHEAALSTGNEIKKTVDFYMAGKSMEPIENIYLSGIYSEIIEFKNILTNITELKIKVNGIINLIEDEKHLLSIVPKLQNGAIYSRQHLDGSLYKPLTEMWATFGLIANR
jgi:Tfp pilus assembly PilM family ATPase